MSQTPEPNDVDVSGRGETQPASDEDAREHADHADRLERRSEPAGDAVAVHGPAEHDDEGGQTDQPHPENTKPQPE